MHQFKMQRHLSGNLVAIDTGAMGKMREHILPLTPLQQQFDPALPHLKRTER